MRHRRFPVGITCFTLTWLVLTIVAFALGHWVAGGICLALTVAQGALVRYRWHHPYGG